MPGTDWQDSMPAEKLASIFGFSDEPSCAFCQKDWHVKPDCPTLLTQRTVAAEQKAERERWERATFGGRKRGKVRIHGMGRRRR